ncbi:MAG: hypothetical protein K2J07_01055 [Muribaculaceae bacterium]|nr:hypothetical protein [Muribaculaceae bacterium]MDE6831309.1 hypothetical protein [Muribaculaceae bacterium]
MLVAASSPIGAAPAWDDPVPAHSRVMPGYSSTDSVACRMASRPLHHIEGIWQLGTDQAIIAVERCTDPSVAHPTTDIYQLTIIDAPRPSTKPGTVLGYAAPSGRPNTYDARIYTTSIRSRLGRPEKFTLTLAADDSHLSISRVKKSWRLLLRQTFHFLMRIGLYADPSADRDIDGLTRLYPPSTVKPAQPVYL